MWDLLETIDRFANFAHIIRIITINKSQWLNHENIFKQVTLKKNIINIKLTNKLTTIYHDIENKTYSGGFDNKIESIMIINIISLLKSFGNKVGFIPITELSSKCLMRKIHLHPRRLCFGSKGTSSHVSFQTRTSYSFDLYNSTPCGIFKGLGRDSRFKIIKIWDLSRKVKFFNGFVNVVLGANNNNSRWKRMWGWRRWRWGCKWLNRHQMEPNVETARVDDEDDMSSTQKG